MPEGPPTRSRAPRLLVFNIQHCIPPGNHPAERAQVLKQAPQLSLHPKIHPSSIQSDHLINPAPYWSDTVRKIVDPMPVVTPNPHS